MAYARFGRDSDVYVYEDGAGWECCGCSLSTDSITRTDSRSGMIEHLQRHITRGDKVPAEAIEELRGEIQSLGDSGKSK